MSNAGDIVVFNFISNPWNWLIIVGVIVISVVLGAIIGTLLRRRDMGD